MSADPIAMALKEAAEAKALAKVAADNVAILTGRLDELTKQLAELRGEMRGQR